MSLQNALRSLAAVAATSAALFGAATPASAALVEISFDTAVGPALPNVGFRGTGEFFVPDACLSLSGFVANNNACSNNTMVANTVSVDFHDLANVNTVLASLTFPGTSFPVVAAEIASGDVTGIATAFADPALLLELNDFVGTVTPSFTPGDDPNVPGGVDLVLCPRGGQCVSSTRATDITITTTRTTETTKVPEPGMLGLLGLAAVMGVGARRRRRG